MTTTTPIPIRKTSDADPSPAPSGRERMRLCHLSTTLQTGGLERLLVDFGRFHDPESFDLCFVALNELGPPADELREAGFAVHSVEMHKRGRLRGACDLASFLARRRIDLVHTHNTYPYFYGALAARRAGRPAVINTQHGRGCGTGWKSLWQFRIANQLSRRVVGVSEDAATLCREQDPSRSKMVQCIWNGIDLDRFRFSGPRDEPTAISVARLSPEKDCATLLGAVRLAVEQVPDFRLKLVGEGSERPRLEALARELGIHSHVEFLGERGDVPDLLRTAGFFVSSSTTEGISLTLLEAMAVGLPIVTTDVGGNPEIVVDGVTGRLVPPRNPDAIAAGIVQMLQDRSRWPEIGRAARDRVEAHFDIRRTVHRYERLYQEIHHAGRRPL